MCGITGYIKLNSHTFPLKDSLENAVRQLNKRGPDHQATYTTETVGLGHARLSIIDTSTSAHQPMSDPSGRYTLIFNGEIYNHQELKKSLPSISFQSSSDTEVLLHLLIHEGASCLSKLNGFFALAFYDKKEDTLLLARDPMGIKPLLYFQSEDQFYFGSEMKALLSFPIPRTINQDALYWYLKLNYLPGTMSLIEGVKKLEPGHYLTIANQQIKKQGFWKLENKPDQDLTYSKTKDNLVSVLEQSVQKRLMSDVPLGSFLSGGTDSSAIVALASRHHSNLSTFSIGYKDHPFFDETHYAELVAKKFNTQHTTFKLTNDDLLHDLGDIMDYIDEPFADSSAIPTYLLSKQTRKHVTVALSGDGADELFGGYYKHMALSQSLSSSPTNLLLKGLNPLFKLMPQSRSGKWSNLFRRLDRFGSMLKMSPNERYWFLASLTNDPAYLLLQPGDQAAINQLKHHFLGENPDLTDYLIADQQLLLPGDMLTKVDLMSMANSLEVRVPFLDKEVVQFANGLPSDYKVKGSHRKRILQDAFQHILPSELHHRPKKGFEIPLLHWMRNELLSDLDETLFNEAFLESQGLFVVDQIIELRDKLMSNNPGDVHGIIWALFVFQKWYQRVF